MNRIPFGRKITVPARVAYVPTFTERHGATIVRLWLVFGLVGAYVMAA